MHSQTRISRSPGAARRYHTYNFSANKRLSQLFPGRAPFSHSSGMSEQTCEQLFATASQYNCDMADTRTVAWLVSPGPSSILLPMFSVSMAHGKCRYTPLRHSFNPSEIRPLGIDGIFRESEAFSVIFKRVSFPLSSFHELCRRVHTNIKPLTSHRVRRAPWGLQGSGLQRPRHAAGVRC